MVYTPYALPLPISPFKNQPHKASTSRYESTPKSATGTRTHTQKNYNILIRNFPCQRSAALARYTKALCSASSGFVPERQEWKEKIAS